MVNPFSKLNENKREEIAFRLYGLNLLLNVIFYFIVSSLNNINEILVFNLLTIGSIEFFVAKYDGGANITRGVLAFFITFFLALIVCSFLFISITSIFKEKGHEFFDRINIYPPNTTMLPFFENNKVEKTKLNPYSKYTVDEKLFMGLALIQEDDMRKALENNGLVEALLPSMYVDLMAERMACAILKNLDMGKTSSDEQKNLNRKILEIENECPIYDEIYNRYFYMYTEAVKAQKISNFYYFESKSSESDSSATIGMFPTMSECKEYNNLFKEKEIALVGKCKTYYK